MSTHEHIFSPFMRGGLASLGLRKFPLEIRNWCSENVSKYWCTFQWEKNKLSLKSWSWLTDAKTAIRNFYKKLNMYQNWGGGGSPKDDTCTIFLIFFYFDFVPQDIIILGPQLITILAWKLWGQVLYVSLHLNFFIFIHTLCV